MPDYSRPCIVAYAVLCIPGAYRVQKTVSDALKLELHPVVSHYMVSENQIQGLWQNNRCP